jgi:hypothetical protein
MGLALSYDGSLMSGVGGFEMTAFGHIDRACRTGDPNDSRMAYLGY